jgi:anthranilate phosphoribosyltransferase
MRHVGPTRKELGIATIMNLLGPLANPAGIRRQVVGVAEAERAALVAEALLRLGTLHALVVHAEVGMDEISPSGCTTVWEIRDGSVSSWILDPAGHGLAHAELIGLEGGDPAANARRIEELFDRRGDEVVRSAVLLNAAAAIYVSGREPSFEGALEAAKLSLEEGRAKAVLDRLREAAGRLD